MVVAIVLVLVVEAAVSSGKVHPGVSVSGIDLGGLTEDEATASLARYVSKAQASPITLTSGDKSWDVMPAEIGGNADVAAAISAAMAVTRESNVFVDMGRRWKLYFSKVDLPLQGSINGDKMDAFLAELARELDVKPVNASLAIEDGEIKVTEHRDGQAVDRDALRDELSPLLLSLHSTEVAIPLVVREAEVKTEDHKAALDRAELMISAPVILTNDANSWTVTVDEIASYLELKSEVVDGAATLVPVLSSAKMSALFAKMEELVANEPVDASFKSDGKKAWVVEGKPGEKLDPEGTAEALMTAALKPTGRSAKVAVMEAEPDFTTEEAEAWGVEDLLASYATTPYYGSSNRQVNVRITTKYAENVFLAPGEVYDFEKVVGPRTPERGYKTAPGIVGEGILEDVFGGGICQVSTTLFNAAFEAGLEILERHNHSLYINHYPDGRDATIAPPGKNLRFRNDTDHYVWIRGVSDGVNTRFNIYGTDDGRKVDIKFSGFSYGAGRTEETVLDKSLPPGAREVVRSGQSARSCSVKRTVTMPDGTVLHDGPEVFKSYYPAMSKLIKVGPTPTTTTTLPSSTTSTTEPGSGTTIVTEF
ncbi:MAG: VanW family protein [Thermoleophilia bacterium]|nr:VanW family protein [Thermoleophilia bacterium]